MKTLPLLVAVLSLLVLHGVAIAKPSAAILPNDMDHMATIRHAGLTEDVSQVPVVLEALRTKLTPSYRKEALHALAQMGATQALPDIDRIIEDDNDPDSVNYAKVEKARLLAEDEAKAAVTILQSATRINAFYAHLGLSPASLNSGAAKYAQEKSQKVTSDAPSIVPTEVYAMREVADMVYHGRYTVLAASPEVNQVNFSLDYGSALKMRYAPLAKERRAEAIIEAIANIKSFTKNEYYDLQLAEDEESAGSHAAATEMQKMTANRGQYSSEGFAALFDVLRSVGDKELGPMFVRFKNDPNPDVAYAAKYRFCLKNTAFVPGY